MRRYIDASQIKYEREEKLGLGIDYGINEQDHYFIANKEQIDSIPPADVVPIKYGVWERFRESPNGPEHIKCSVCGQFWSIANHDKIFKKCFNCGADMRERSEDVSNC